MRNAITHIIYMIYNVKCRQQMHLNYNVKCRDPIRLNDLEHEMPLPKTFVAVSPRLKMNKRVYHGMHTIPDLG